MEVASSDDDGVRTGVASTRVRSGFVFPSVNHDDDGSRIDRTLAS